MSWKLITTINIRSARKCGNRKPSSHLSISMAIVCKFTYYTPHYHGNSEDGDPWPPDVYIEFSWLINLLYNMAIVNIVMLATGQRLTVL